MNNLLPKLSWTRIETSPSPEHDVESFTGNGDANLSAFRLEVEVVKKDIADLEKLLCHLQTTHEESKVAQSSSAVRAARAQMGLDVERVLKMTKLIKGKLQAFEQANKENRELPGFGPGSSVDHARRIAVYGLRHTLMDRMKHFQRLRTKIDEEYKETVQRRFFAVTGQHPDDDTVENLISSGETEAFFQKAIQEQGKEQIMDAILEMQERQDAMKDLEKSLEDLAKIIQDLAEMVEAQGVGLDTIEENANTARIDVIEGTDMLNDAHKIRKKSKKWNCILILLVLGVVTILLCVLLLIVPRGNKEDMRRNNHPHIQQCVYRKEQD